MTPANQPRSQPISQRSLPFFEIAADVMCILDVDGICQRVNTAFTHCLGYSQAEIVGKALATLSDLDNRAAHETAFSQTTTNQATKQTTEHAANATDSATAKQQTFQYRTKTGQAIWLSWSITLASEQNQKHLYCVGRNVTAEVANRQQQQKVAAAEYATLEAAKHQIKNQAAIAKREAQMYADVVHNMQIGLYIWQLETNASQEPAHGNGDDGSGEDGILRLVGTNSAASRFTGINAEKLIGQTIDEVFPALTNTDIPTTYKEVARTGKGCDLGEVTYGDDRVDRGIFSVKAFPLQNQCIGIAFENITDRKREENAHLENEAQLRIIFNQASVGMARLSPEGQWIQVNQRLCELLGYSRPELLDKHFAEVTHPEDMALDQHEYERLYSGELEQTTFEKRYITQQGDSLWANVTVSTVRDPNDALLYFIATIQNITERKKAAIALQNQKNDLVAVNLMLTDTMTRLEQRNEELDQFAYVTSHDLKAPLRAIINLASWIEEDIGSTLPEENRAQFTLLKSRVHRMEGLINGLLEYSRVDRTHQSHERIDTTELLNDIIDSVSPPATFNIELAPDLPVLEAKKTPLVQVFSNLITNAIKHHNRTDGTIRISVQDADNFYAFTVSDDGPGIDPTYHEKVFVIFQTLKARDDLESTGIGLSLVKKIVLAEHGNISLASEPGKGAAFTFTWPKSPNQGIHFA